MPKINPKRTGSVLAAIVGSAEESGDLSIVIVDTSKAGNSLTAIPKTLALFINSSLIRIVRSAAMSSAAVDSSPALIDTSIDVPEDDEDCS